MVNFMCFICKDNVWLQVFAQSGNIDMNIFHCLLRIHSGITSLLCFQYISSMFWFQIISVIFYASFSVCRSFHYVSPSLLSACRCVTLRETLQKRKTFHSQRLSVSSQCHSCGSVCAKHRIETLNKGWRMFNNYTVSLHLLLLPSVKCENSSSLLVVAYYL